MPLIRLSTRAVARQANVRIPARALSTSTPLYALHSRKTPGPRNSRKSVPSARQPLGRTPASPISKTPSNSNPETTPAQSHQQAEQPENAPSRIEAVSAALRESAAASDSNLLAPVNIPDDPHSVLKSDHPAMSILANSTIVIQRQLEMMNVLLGFEQANRYVIMDGQGNHIGYLAERENGFGGTMARQMFKTHRSFTTHVFDKNEREVLRVSLAPHQPILNTRLMPATCSSIALLAGSTLRSASTTVSTATTKNMLHLTPLTAQVSHRLSLKALHRSPLSLCLPCASSAKPNSNGRPCVANTTSSSLATPPPW